MRVYLLKESDFEKLAIVIQMIETESKLAPADEPIDALTRKYHYQLYTWMNDVKGDK